jgi:hypothetical protein
MKTVLYRYIVTRGRTGVKPKTHVKLKKRHVKITRPKGFFRHLSNSCYASHPILCIKSVEAFRSFIGLDSLYRHATNKATFILLFSTLTRAPPGAFYGAQASLRLLDVYSFRRYPGYQVRQLNFIIGIQGTIVEHTWRCNLTILGIERRRQDKITRRCMTASIEGMQRVLSAAGTGGEG